MTDNEIIKALECCIFDDVKECDNCPYYDKETEIYCVNDLLKDALNLINRQKAEIESLKNDRDFWESAAKTEVSEVIIEFAERILKDSRKYFVSTPFVEHVTAIATEMIEKER